MGNMTLSQARAAYALHRAEQVPDTLREDFKRVITKAPVQILTNGLIMTLTFWEGKGKAEFNAAEQALSDWIQLRLTEGGGVVPSLDIARRPQGQEDLLRALTGQQVITGAAPDPASVEGLLFATAEALELLNWLKRMVGRDGYTGGRGGAANGGRGAAGQRQGYANGEG